jgi:hypothetical protein
MAEQISHNVVNEPESMSGSPLVDAAANQTTTESAARGIPPTTTTIETAKPTASEPSHLPTTSTKLPTSAIVTTTEASAGSGAAKDAAEPSAGEAAALTAPSQGGTSSVNVEGKGSSPQGDLASGAHEDGDDNRSTADVSVDVSVNSDTDMSRAELEKKEAHIRANSVKKPVTFSKVSITKAFMNKAAPTTAVASGKIGDKSELERREISVSGILTTAQQARQLRQLLRRRLDQDL